MNYRSMPDYVQFCYHCRKQKRAIKKIWRVARGMWMETLLQHLEMVVYGLLLSTYQHLTVLFGTLRQWIVYVLLCDLHDTK
jgi:hypothetical protein